ncbi:Methionyl tRNA synthetase cytoplasmic [Fasciola gigantica]|uniref:Methionine--tRNA ligase, cytoplasmic n=1 Tax=Fasciola gigantica TaxID=46835 RepID=A0A504YWC7_FASGI|nr:Methionyl tRNA synthetase cytoplasmic [Fasciola gigantica]
MILLYNPSSTDSLGVLGAALIKNEVQIRKTSTLDGFACALVVDGLPILSRNAIICRLLHIGALDPTLCEFLLWESVTFQVNSSPLRIPVQPLLKKFISGSSPLAEDCELLHALEKLESRLLLTPILFTLDPLSVSSIVFWSDFHVLHKRDPDHMFSRFSRLQQFFTQISSVKPLMDAVEVLEKSSSTFASAPRSLSGSSSTRRDKPLVNSSKQTRTKTTASVTVPPISASKAVKEVQNSVADECEVTISVSLEDQVHAANSFQLCTDFGIPIHSIPKCPALKITGYRNILITSALPYVNNVPHLGNMIGSTLSASTFAAYCHIAGQTFLFYRGNDIGTPQRERTIPCWYLLALICYLHFYFVRVLSFVCKLNGVSFGFRIVQDLFAVLWNNGFISQDVVEQLFCEHCSKFLADRFVEGVCPLCKYDDARGDQCDKCGRLMNAIELRQPRCKTCGKEPVVRSSKHLFLDLPKVEPKLTEFINHHTTDPTSLWTANARQISQTWLRDGLKARCITRDLKWGVPVPVKEFADKVFYVWFDAPIGYLSITANYTPEWRRWWLPTTTEREQQSPIELYQFMAKDNVPFHAIIFPSCLLAANQGHTLVKHLLSTEYMNYEGTKFSKSRDIGVFGDGAMRSGIPSNVWRFYLLYRRPETQDSAFSWDDFVLVNNSELLNNLGNFVNRALAFVARFYNSVVPDTNILEPGDTEFLAQVNHLIGLYVDNLEACRLREALRQILAISRLGNGYFQVNQPWVAYKKEETKARAGVVIGVAANVTSLLGLLLYPYMPSVSKQIWCDQCNLPQSQLSLVPILRQSCRLYKILPSGHQIGKPAPLFRKIEPDEAARLSEQFGGQRPK